MKQSDELAKLRHSCAHLLAAAVVQLWPRTKPTIGPAIEDGFYYDFDFGAEKISENDLSKIEKKMRQLVKHWTAFERRETTTAEARNFFKNNPYKLELIDELEKKDETVFFYTSGNFTDLCRGGHCVHPDKELTHFKLLSIAGAYWRGSEKNKMLTRIYGTCFPTKEALDKYLWSIVQAKKRDHRKLGRDLDLFIVSDQVGGGLPIFLPHGAILRNIISDYLSNLKRDNNYQFVWSPHIAKSQIYHTSGHWGKYDAMFSPMTIEDEEYVLKPMNCPHHFQVYLSKPRSYRDLPLRIAENGTVYRHEKSGELNGLLRVRSLTIDDTHAFIRNDQIGDELVKVLGLIRVVLNTFGFSKYRARISVRNKATPEKYIGKSDYWDESENSLKKAAKKVGFDFELGIGEAAFYGPKVDIMVSDSLGRQWQLSTVQLDYNQSRNFKMTYTDQSGSQKYPAILHIAMVGSLERFIGILIEHYAGAFPLWLAPVQVMVLPVSEKYWQYGKKIISYLVNLQVRAALDDNDKTLCAKIREAVLKKVPYLCIIGDKEYRSSLNNKEIYVSVRDRQGKTTENILISKFVKKLKENIEKKL